MKWLPYTIWKESGGKLPRQWRLPLKHRYSDWRKSIRYFTSRVRQAVSSSWSTTAKRFPPHPRCHYTFRGTAPIFGDTIKKFMKIYNTILLILSLKKVQPKNRSIE